jgi:antitoxin (DNA-binding transcriptional repressor) of toxin-antitoxin stability system
MMETVTVDKAQTDSLALLAEVEGGTDVTGTRHGRAIAGIVPSPKIINRVPGGHRKWPGWENFVFDPSVFAPMTDEEELEAERWDL